MYNLAKVSKGSILAWFNEIFDALTKLAVDVELSVKNGSELLDRLMKDIVSERSSYCHPDFKVYQEEGMKKKPSSQEDCFEEKEERVVEIHPLSLAYSSVPGSEPFPGGPLTFNVPRFIPLLKERYE